MFEVQAIPRNGHTSLKLKGELTIYTASEARLQLEEAVTRATSPELDLAEVDELDTAGVQVLLWLKREALALGHALPFVNHSPSVVEVLDLLNLAGRLGDPILLAPSDR